MLSFLISIAWLKAHFKAAVTAKCATGNFNETFGNPTTDGTGRHTVMPGNNPN